MKTKHRTHQELIEYLDNPECKEHESIEKHLAECDECTYNLGLNDALMIGIKKVGERSRKLVEDGFSAHLKDEEIRRFINNEAYNGNERKEPFLHLSGCDSCLKDTIAVENVLYKIKNGELIDRINTVYEFIKNFPARVVSINKEAVDLIREAARQGIALFGIAPQFSFAFKSTKDSDVSSGKDYRKMGVKDFKIEVIQPNTNKSIPKVIICVLTKENFKQARITICTEVEQAEVVALENGRAIINKENVKADEIRYIKAEKFRRYSQQRPHRVKANKNDLK
ncbi:MAG: hypothetical protein SCARUB_00762 [Candidatus Scalindua rubra]|uniref:Uncharacterized protein n=1 Tax=Candidatus Scalindua rubra TaxID=1872076 RepID=A0A1E3XER3_9BACT|nr:MAG: hypothetical protein SCARUB_00762 [Candidatus Scalindua rubra]